MKSTKKSFLLSVLSLIVCVAMLVSTTFAWFTDSVKSGKNKIQAGNLDIELEYLDTTGETATWKPVTENVSLFNDSALWEPGHTEVAYLRLSNKGTLALKYNLAINVYNEKEGTNVAGDSFKLSDYIYMGIDEAWDGTAYADRAAARAAVSESGKISNYTKAGNMIAGANAEMFAIVVYMPEEVGNVANYKTGTEAPYIEMGVEVVATQLTSEKDSFDDQYDVKAPWVGGVDEEGLIANTDAEAKTVEIESAEQLAAFAAAVNAGNDYAGYTIKLINDIDLNNVAWTPINANNNEKPFTFDGNGKTIKNLKVVGEKAVGLFGHATSCTIKNLTVDGANVSGINHVAAIAGNALCTKIENCTVKNAVITTSVKNNDDGDKAGAVAGYLSGESVAYVKGCTVENCTVTGYRDIAALVGYANGTSEVSGNTIKNCIVINDRSNNYKNYVEDADFDANEVVGEKVAAATVEGNTSDNVTISKIAPIIVPENATPEQTQTAVNEAVAAASAGDILVLPETEQAIKLPAEIASTDVVIKGAGSDKTEIDRTGEQGLGGANLNISDVTLVGGTADFQGLQHTDTEYYENCKFTGKTFFYGNEVVCKNCVFEQTTYDYCFWTYGAKNITFENCTFNTVGKAAKVYNENTTDEFNVTFTNCVFNTSNTEKDKPAIAVNSLGAKFNIVCNGCTATDFANGTSVEDDAMTAWYNGRMASAPAAARQLIGCEGQLDKITVTIDGVSY